MTIADIETYEAEYGQTWYLPVTPADLAGAGIELDSPFGIDAEEAAELAEAEGVARIVFGITRDEAGCERSIDVECHQIDGVAMVEAIRGGYPAVPRWQRCSRRYAMTAGSAQRLAFARNEARMWALARSRVADLDDALEAAASRA